MNINLRQIFASSSTPVQSPTALQVKIRFLSDSWYGTASPYWRLCAPEGRGGSRHTSCLWIMGNLSSWMQPTIFYHIRRKRLPGRKSEEPCCGFISQLSKRYRRIKPSIRQVNNQIIDTPIAGNKQRFCKSPNSILFRPTRR